MTNKMKITSTVILMFALCIFGAQANSKCKNIKDAKSQTQWENPDWEDSSYWDEPDSIDVDSADFVEYEEITFPCEYPTDEQVAE